MLKAIENFVRNPWVELLLGIVICSTGLMEAGDDMFADITSGNLGAHHGVMLLGLAHAIKEVPVLLAGFALMSRASDDSH
jgi:hypothetical protein